MPKESPKDLAAERALLGAMMVPAPTTRDLALEELGLDGADRFFDGRHATIYDVIVGLHSNGYKPTRDMVRDQLARDDQFGAIGEEYFETLWEERCLQRNASAYADSIRNHDLLRRQITVAQAIAQRAFEGGKEAQDLQNEAERELLALAERAERRGPAPLSEAVGDLTDSYREAEDAPDGVPGLPSGLRDLDQLTGGFQKGHLIVVAARPSMGKSGFGATISRKAALDRGVASAVFSCEMPRAEYAGRYLAPEAKVSHHDGQRGVLTDEDWSKISSATRRLHDLPIWIDDTAGISLSELRSKARRLVTEEGVEMIIVDYLQLMTARESVRQGANREQEIALISRTLKRLAKELDIPVIALSQLNRGVENRGGDKRPLLSDLRESGALEQDSDLVMFIYRAEQYDIMQDQQGRSTEGIAEIIVGKHRGGPTGTAVTRFVKEYATFENLTTRDDSPPSPPQGGDGAPTSPERAAAPSEPPRDWPSGSDDAPF